MGWSSSAVFRAFVVDVLENAAAFDLGADGFKLALYNDSITPDKDSLAANTAYDAGVWVAANEVSDASNWAAGGRLLDNTAVTTPAGGTVRFSASNEASGPTATLTNVYGGLVYDDTLGSPVADQGVCYLYFGGQNAVTNGTLTVVFSGNGLFQVTV
jgi:hypothetical protein